MLQGPLNLFFCNFQKSLMIYIMALEVHRTGRRGIEFVFWCSMSTWWIFKFESYLCPGWSKMLPRILKGFQNFGILGINHNPFWLNLKKDHPENFYHHCFSVCKSLFLGLKVPNWEVSTLFLNLRKKAKVAKKLGTNQCINQCINQYINRTFLLFYEIEFEWHVA